MRAIFSKPRSFRTVGKEKREKSLKDAADRMQQAVKIFTDTILERTPVYTGRTLVNFHWTVDQPATEVRKPVVSSGLPGKTSNLALGSEPRRSANAAVVLSEANAVIERIRVGGIKGDIPTIYLVNNSPSYYAVEYGTYSENARTPPGGITRAGEVKIANILR